MNLEPHEAGLIAFLGCCFFLLLFLWVLSILGIKPSTLSDAICAYREAKSNGEKLIIFISIIFKMSFGSLILGLATIMFGCVSAIFGYDVINVRGLLQDFYRFILRILGMRDIPFAGLK